MWGSQNVKLTGIPLITAANPAGNLLWAALFQKDAVMLNFPNLIEAQTQLKTEASSGITVRRTDRKEPVMAVPHCLVG